MLRPLLLAVAVLATLGADGAHAQDATGGSLFSFSKAFTPDRIGPGSTTTLVYTIDNTDNFEGLTGLGFSHTLPAGLTVASPAAASSTCSGRATPTISAPPAGTTIVFSGGEVPVGATCTVQVNVTSATVGTATSTTGQLTADQSNAGTATADLTVDTALPGFSKSFAPASVVLGGRSTLTFTIDNSLNASGVVNLDFTDAFPAGLAVADPANASSTCGTAVIPPTLTAQPGATSVVLDANGVGSFPAVQAGASCAVTVDVVGTAAGALENVTSPLLADFVPAGTAGAVLTVVSGAVVFERDFIDDPTPPGDVVTLQYTIRNLSRSESATDLFFSDDLVLTPFLFPPTPTGSGDGALPRAECGGTFSYGFMSTFEVGASGNPPLVLTGGSLAPGASCTFRVALTVPGGAAPGTYTLTGGLLSAILGGTPVSITGSAADLFVEPIPQLTKEYLVLDATPTLVEGPVVAGGSVFVRYTITNTSTTSAATDVTFVDEYTGTLPFPVTVTLPPVPDPACGLGSSVVLVSLGTGRMGLRLAGGSLDPGATCSFTVEVEIPEGFPAGTYSDATEAITATVDGATRTGRPASDDLLVIAAPQLALSFTPASVQRSGVTRLETRIEYDLGNPTAATGIGFEIDLDLGGMFAGLGRPASACGGTLDLFFPAGVPTLRLTGATLDPGESCTFSVSLDISATAPYGTATFSSSNGTATVGGSPLTVPVATATLDVTPVRWRKLFGFLDVAGETPRVAYAFRNDDPTNAATGVFFTDNLNAALSGLQVASTTPILNTCGFSSTSGTTFFIASGGTIPAGGSCALVMPITLPADPAPGQYSSPTSNLAFSLDGTGRVVDPATGTLTFADRSPAFSKAFSPSTVLGGELIELTYTIDNTGQREDATSLAFTEEFPDGLSLFTSSSTENCGESISASVSGSTLTVSGGTVVADEICRVVATLTTRGRMEATFETISGELTSSAGSSGSASATLTVENPPVVVLLGPDIIGDENGVLDAGEQIAYSAAVINRTDEPVSGLVLSVTPGQFSTLLVGTTVPFQPGATVVSGATPGDAEVIVELGVIAAQSNAGFSFFVNVDDPLPESAPGVCTQAVLTGLPRAVLSDDDSTPAYQDETCVDAERPQLDVEITNVTFARGGTIEVTATAENTTDVRVAYRRRLLLTHPDGRVKVFPADREFLDAGASAPASLVDPAIPLAANAPGGTYLVELVSNILDSPVIRDRETFEFTLPPLWTDLGGDLDGVVPTAGPNPFLGQTVIRFPVREAGAVQLRVFDVAGREVATLVDGELARGVHDATFDGTDRPAGVYLWRLTVNGEVTTGAVTLVR